MRTFLHSLIASILIWKLKRGKPFLFKHWILLEGKKEKLIKAVREPEFPDLLLDFVSYGLGVSSRYFEDAEWQKIVELFYLCLSKFPSVQLPMLEPNDEPYKEDPWSYENRSWHLYSHLLANAYGWTLEYISQLQIEDALAKIQEIIVDKQLAMEFQYGLSEIAYPYNTQTKKSTFKPLDRPHWMRPTVKKDIPRFVIPQGMMPEGVVVMDNVLPNEYLPKEVSQA